MLQEIIYRLTHVLTTADLALVTKTGYFRRCMIKIHHEQGVVSRPARRALKIDKKMTISPLILNLILLQKR